MLDYANKQLEGDPIGHYKNIDEATEKGQKYLKHMQVMALQSLGYFLKPSELFSTLVERGMLEDEKDDAENEDEEEEEADNYGETSSSFILEDLRDILRQIETSTQGTASEKDFINLFEDLNLNSVKLGRTPNTRNKVIINVLKNLAKIDFKLEDTDSDILGDAYELSLIHI